MELKNILKKLIKERDTSIAKVSRTTKIPSKTIYNWLSGSEPKSFLQVKRVADYFEVSLDYLCFGIEPNKIHEGNSVTSRGMSSETIERYNDEINAGVFEVVLRRIKK
ncbi:MAG: helix-turn-helix transcriptional regulator [Oligoflexia bacterium]|nr:helix-turn-helix transcriptional regulator [Oligoflexia bacterium]